jgi:predicted SAM-dependent methyltransferase
MDPSTADSARVPATPGRLRRLWSGVRKLASSRHRVLHGRLSFRLFRPLQSLQGGGRPGSPLRLHVGSGDRILPGWVNIDLKYFPGVDLVANVAGGLPFTGVATVFAEHFLEHLDLLVAVAFLAEAHRVLAPAGKLRLSTPNLDWVLSTHYPLAGSVEEREMGAIVTNRAFHGWRHRFLWNRELLESALEACGFVEIRWCAYGESDEPELRGLERHETYEDRSDCPHVLIVEARKGPPQETKLRLLREKLYWQFSYHLPD